ncbi:ABC transporter substrate-binding protein [Glaciibacter psychrotolerans]|uniref:Branched-chain amino acid transport system substrate-binding protein n=1 Tax=Glaciibacter psychrotolerans TaxID=670054 RepID=A0A7Z0EGF5_9MICO|nr:ABC transporter substrate-binding protein [Leifsonia psychrotolerans]NYJ20447.1 branched-chain amino acid transport system substrate-binding protein [Leifsonia psychrotolerans]
MKSWTQILTLVTCASLLAGVAGCSSNPAAGDGSKTQVFEKSEPIIIGLDEDSTGPGAAYMTITGATIRMAVDEINADGGVLGQELKLVVGNDESDPTKTPTVLRKLVDDGAKAVFIATGGGSALQAKSVMKQAGVLAIAPITITSSVGLPPDNEFMYTLANSLDDFAAVYCGAFKAEGYKTLGMISDTTPAVDAISSGLVPGLEKCIDVVADEKAPLDAADLSAQVARIKKADPDVVLVMSVGGNFEVLAHNTLAPQLPGVKRFSLASIGNQPDTWKLAQPGVLADVVYMGSIDPANPRTAALDAKLKKAHGDSYRLTAYDAQAYDAVHLLKAAIEAAGGATDSAAIKKAYENLSGYETTFGQDGLTVSYSADKHIGADALCGLVLSTFDEKNEPIGAWPNFQVSCAE